MTLTLEHIRKALPAAKFGSALPSSFSQVEQDSRNIKDNYLFVAIKSDPKQDFECKRNGHEFLNAAFKSGATGALVSDQTALKKLTENLQEKCIVVPNTLEALQALAAYHLSSLPAVKVGITGSYGKTTVKECAKAMLIEHFGERKIFASEGNKNNMLGLPLEAFKVKKEHEIAIFEMGMNHPGEIKKLCEVVSPAVGLITTIGEAHRGNFKSVKDIAYAKAELFDSLPPSGLTIVNENDPLCVEMSKRSKAKLVKYSVAKDAELPTQLLGRRNQENAYAALILAITLGASQENAVAGLQKVKPAKGRLETMAWHNGSTLINDSYNANPSSMQFALEVLSKTKAKRKISVLGTMGELGSAAKEAHKEIGALCASFKLDKTFFCGEYADNYKNGALAGGATENSIAIAENALSLKDCVKNFVKKGDVILLKGSRAAKMERVI